MVRCPSHFKTRTNDCEMWFDPDFSNTYKGFTIYSEIKNISPNGPSKFRIKRRPRFIAPSREQYVIINGMSCLTGYRIQRPKNNIGWIYPYAQHSTGVLRVEAYPPPHNPSTPLIGSYLNIFMVF